MDYSFCAPNIINALAKNISLLFMNLGFYDECLRNSHTSYFLTNIILNTSDYTSITNGFCLNKTCSAQNVTFAINELLSFSNTSKVGKVIQITGEEGANTFDSKTIIVISFICFIYVLGLIDPLYNFFNSRNRKFNKDNNIISKEIPDQEIPLIENASNKEHKVSSNLQIKDVTSRNKTLELLKCFSITDNWKKLWEVRKGPLDFLYGVKSLAFFYVILGHGIMIRGKTMIQNPEEAYEIIKTNSFEFLVSGFYSADVLFWIGGFLCAFILFDVDRQL